MSEKLSEQPVRAKKIERLKAKILAEIEEEHEYLKLGMSEDSKHFDDYVEKYYQLAQLKNYITADNTFWTCEAMYEKEDCVVYQVSDKTLDIWLQDDYNFVHSFMVKIYDRPWALFKMLNDGYFGYQFTNLLDIIIYDDRRAANV